MANDTTQFEKIEAEVSEKEKVLSAEEFIEYQFNYLEQTLDKYMQNIEVISTDNINALQLLVTSLCNNLIKIEKEKAQKFKDRLSEVNVNLNKIVGYFDERKKQLREEIESSVSMKKAMNAYGYSANKNEDE